MKKKKNKKEYNKEKDTSQILWMIFLVPIGIFVLDLANLGKIFFPYINNLTDKYDWLSFIGTYAGTIVSAIFLLFITKMDRRDNNEILRRSQRPYLDVNWTALDSDFIKENKTNINRQVFFYDLFGGDKYESNKEYFTIEIHNTGASTAILNVDKCNFTLRYKKYLGIYDGEEKYEDDRYTIKLSSIVKRKSIAAGESMFVIIDSILLYNTKNWKIDSNISIENSRVIYKDLFNCDYIDVCNFENGKIISVKDNELIKDKEISE